MMTSLLMLGLAYALVAALLLALCIGLEGRRLLKISLIVLVSAFYSVTWLGHQSMLGWATSEDMPDAFRVLWITIDEPHKATKEAGGIFFWVRELDEAGIPQGAPRAYHVPFTEQAAEEALDRAPQHGSTPRPRMDRPLVRRVINAQIVASNAQGRKLPHHQDPGMECSFMSVTLTD